MATVKLTNVKKVYGKNTVAVQDFNLEIADKEFVVFVGPSGCGKSTTLRMIAGLEDITEGTIEIDGRVVNDLQPKDRDIAMVFQNYALYPHLTVFENMAFALRLKKVPQSEAFAMLKALNEKNAKKAAAEAQLAEGENADTDVSNDEQAGKPEEIFDDVLSSDTSNSQPDALAEATTDSQSEVSDEASNDEQEGAEIIDSAQSPENASKTSNRLVKIPYEVIYDRVTEAAEILGITEYLTRRPRELSGGQRQRVAIGRAMVRDSQVFLMDEPLSNLDAKLRNQMRAEIILLRKKIDTTFIYVTHDQTEAMTLGDRIVIMKDGFIMQVGTPTQVFDMPDNLFVAEFIGAPKMNTFKTALEREGDSYFVSPCGVRMPVDGEKAEALLAKDAQPQDIVLGVRPEHITLTNKANPAAIPCVIEVNEMMGSELHLHVVSETGDKIIVRVPTVSLSATQISMLKTGAKIYIAFKSKVMHFFNAQSERNLLAADVEEANQAQNDVDTNKNDNLTPDTDIKTETEEDKKSKKTGKFFAAFKKKNKKHDDVE